MKSRELPIGIRAFELQGGGTTYEARVNRRNAKPMSRRFKTVLEATNWKAQADALIEGGMDPRYIVGKNRRLNPPLGTQPPSASLSGSNFEAELTVKQAVEKYLTFRQQSHNPLPANSMTDYQQVANDLGVFPVSALRNEDLANYITVLLRTPIKRDAKKQAEGKLKGSPRTYQPASVRKFIYALKIALEWNAKNGKADLNPHLFAFEKKTMPSAWAGKRDRRLFDGEEAQLYAAALSRGNFTYNESDWQAAIGFALETAMREQEITLARWVDISPSGLKMHIPASHTKTKTARTILLSQKAREILALQKERCPKGEARAFHQFPNAQALCEAFARLRERAGISDLHFHDLRHEATSRLCESGQLNMMAIMEMTGHRSLATFQGYVHLIAKGDSATLD